MAWTGTLRIVVYRVKFEETETIWLACGEKTEVVLECKTLPCASR